MKTKAKSEAATLGKLLNCFSELRSIADSLGMKNLDVTFSENGSEPSNGQATETDDGRRRMTPAAKRAVGRASVLYWKRVRRLARNNNCGIPEARKLYLQQFGR